MTPIFVGMVLFSFISFLFLLSPLLRERYEQLDIGSLKRLWKKANHGEKREKEKKKRRKRKKRGKTVSSWRVEQARRLPEYLESSGYPDLPTMNHHGLTARPDYTTSWCDLSNQREKKQKNEEQLVAPSDSTIWEKTR